MQALFRKRRSLTVLTAASLAVMAAAFLAIAVSYGSLSHTIVLRYDASRGVDLFGARSSLWGVWTLGAAIMAVNGGLAYEFFHRERFLSYLLVALNALISVLVLAVVGILIGMN